MVHRITMHGEYDGDLLDPSRTTDPRISRNDRETPQGVLLIDGSPSRFWIIAERSLTEWSTGGEYVRTIYSNTAILEDPTAIRRIGEEIFVLSEDKERMLVFDLDGEIVAEFGYPKFGRGKEMILGKDAMLYVASSIRSTKEGLIAVWDPNERGPDAAAIAHYVMPSTAKNGTTWLQSLVFDDNGDLLVTEFPQGRLERWSLEANMRLEILLDSDQWGEYRELARGPDGLVYLAGPRGLYRFDSLATATDLVDMEPFFDAASISASLEEEFSPASIVFVPASLLTGRAIVSTQP